MWVYRMRCWLREHVCNCITVRIDCLTDSLVDKIKCDAGKRRIRSPNASELVVLHDIEDILVATVYTP